MPGECILVVDDEQHILDVVIYVLEESGFTVVSALDGETALRLFREKQPDLVVLDLNLPGIQGLDVFRRMREAQGAIPVIMLTSRSEEIDRVLGLELGADDYVTKPFSTRELVARVRAVLRRTGQAGGTGPEPRLAHGPIVLDTNDTTFTYNGQRIAMTRAEFRLMECLVRYPARVFTRDMLIDRIHDGHHVVTDRSVDATVKRVRKKLGAVDPGVDPIETVHGIGYKLNQEIDRTP